MTSIRGRKKYKTFNVFVALSPGPLSYAVLNKLAKEKNLKISVITNERDLFTRFIEDKKLVRKIHIHSVHSLEAVGRCDYFLYIDSDSGWKSFNKLVALAQTDRAKSIFIFPYENTDPDSNEIDQKVDTLEKTNLPYQIFFVKRDFMKKRTIKDKNPLDKSILKKIGRLLIRSLFVFNYPGKKVVIKILIGKKQEEENNVIKYANTLSYQVADETIYIRTKPPKKIGAFYPNKISVKKNPLKTIDFSPYKLFDKIKTRLLTIDKLREQKKKRVLRKKDLLLAGAFVILSVFIFPSLLLTFIFLNLLIAGGWHFIDSGTPLERTYTLAKLSSRTLGGYFEIASFIPGINTFFSGPKKYTSFLEKTSEIGIERNKIDERFKKLLQSVSEERGNTFDLSKDLSLELDKYETELGFWQNDLGSFNSYFQKLSLLMAGIENPDELRSKISLLSRLSEDTSDILGFNSTKTYALILQNDRIERPAGGKITSIFLTAFSEGKLSEIETYSVGELDARLKGEVVPPDPIKKYYKAGWLLEDANWSPDFSQAAQKVMWFLEKEIEVRLDGVIAVNTKFINFLKRDDFRNINALSEDNINNRKLLSLISMMSTNKKQKVVRKIVEGLADKEIQLYFDNSHIEETISGLGWSGNIRSDACGINCFNDIVSLNNADFNLADASYPVDKKVRLEISFEEEVIKRKMSIYLKNVSDSEQRNYLRIVAPSGVGFSHFTLTNGNVENIPLEINENGFSEAGALLVIKPRSELKGILSWEGGTGLEFNRKGSYKLTWIKQAGTNPVSASLVIRPPKDPDLNSLGNLTLTNDNKLQYNTNLAKDMIFQFSWK